MTAAERSAYQRTSTFAEVMAVIEAFEVRSSLLHREPLLTTVEGREVPVLVLADPPPVTSPEQARASGKPVIYIQGNIHGGEVEGKEAALKLMREILLGDKAHLLESQIIVVVPVYNADGNDAMTADSRPSQEGSPLLAGARFAHGYDLNRDGMAIEATETRALNRAADARVTIEGVLNYNRFQATLEATVPKAYIVPSQFSAIADKLVEHGIEVERIDVLILEFLR